MSVIHTSRTEVSQGGVHFVLETAVGGATITPGGPGCDVGAQEIAAAGTAELWDTLISTFEELGFFGLISTKDLDVETVDGAGKAFNHWRVLAGVPFILPIGITSSSEENFGGDPDLLVATVRVKNVSLDTAIVRFVATEA